jgi:hypothetical protein
MLATLLELFPAPFGYLHLSPVAWIATVILKTIGVPAELTTRDAAAGYCLLDLDGVDYLVTHECTGIVAAFIVTAAIIAYPTARTQKHRGLALAIPCRDAVRRAATRRSRCGGTIETGVDRRLSRVHHGVGDPGICHIRLRVLD